MADPLRRTEVDGLPAAARHRRGWRRQLSGRHATRLRTEPRGEGARPDGKRDRWPPRTGTVAPATSTHEVRTGRIGAVRLW